MHRLRLFLAKLGHHDPDGPLKYQLAELSRSPGSPANFAPHLAIETLN